LESLEKASTFTENIFEGINQSKTLIALQLRNSILCKYEETTENFEVLVKNLTENLEAVNLSDKTWVDSIKRMKAELEAKSGLFNNTEFFNQTIRRKIRLCLKET
jgi:malonyl CoA-acyl carrier protein transacylase